MCLNVFGTHSLTNSFLATLVFFALEPLANILNTVVANKTIRDSHTHRDEHGTQLYNGSIHNNTNGKENISHSRPNVYDSKYSGRSSLSSHRSQSVAELFFTADLYSGLLLALCIYIRIDVVALPVILVFVTMDNIHENIKCLFNISRNYSVGFVIGILIGGYYDVMSYGQWFMSPLQWLRFNVLSKTSGFIFGISPSFFYCTKMYDVEPLLIICVGLILLSLPLEIQRKQDMKNNHNSDNHTSTVNNTDYRGIVIVCVLMTLYSGNSHKELRFLHNTVIFIYISLARAIYTLCKALSTSRENQNSRQYCIYSVYLYIALFSSSHIYVFCNLSESSQSKWTYSGMTDSNEVNACLDFIRQNSDVTGVVIDRPLHLTGGYSLLNKDVPIFALNKYEFMEYDNKSKLNVVQLDLRYSYNHEYELKQVHVFGRISDFISIYNTPYLLKQIISKKEYNYLVLRSDRTFTETGYRQVFTVGNSRVLKRTFDADSEAKMAETVHHIPVGTNATVLEYEGDWLIYFGLYSKAEQRLLFSNRLDPMRPGPFRALLGIYKRLGVTRSYQSVLEACTQVHSVKACLQPYQPLKLHLDYYRKNTVKEMYTS